MAEHLILVLSLLTSALLGWRLQEAHGRKKAGLAPDPALPPVSTVQTGADWPATLVLETLCQDIRARISGMVGLSEQLLAAPLGDDQQRQAELIADSGRTMLRLLGDVMDVTRIDAGGLRLQAEPSDLRELLDHHVNLMQAATRARGLTLALMVDDAVPARVLVDRARLRQVLLNLIGNAVKFTEHGRIDVQARVAQTATGPQLAISVIDPGVGIARARQAQIFQPFFLQPQDSPPAPRITSGTGLGLALSSRIVQAMGGEIVLESAPGLGSCFTVRLPLATQIDAPAEDSAATDPFLAEQLIADPMRLRDLETRYRLRKEALFDGLYAVLAVPDQRAAEADWDGIATQLLRLATVAANFGDDRLGDLARTLHGEFDAQPHPRLRHELLCRWWPVLLEAR